MKPYLENIAKIQDAIAEFEDVKEKMTPFSPKQLEILYAAAFSFYEQGKYAKAIALFIQLILHGPFDVRFWKGLASSHQMEGSYLAAIRAWGIVCILQPQASFPHFHAAECFISLGEQKEAGLALNCAQNRAENFDPLFSKIQVLKERLDYGIH